MGLNSQISTPAPLSPFTKDCIFPIDHLYVLRTQAFNIHRLQAVAGNPLRDTPLPSQFNTGAPSIDTTT